MGATGNNPAYEPYLKAMGAAEERDDVFASVCYCPITDLEHADMAYEWLYGNTDSRKKADAEHQKVSSELAAAFPAYINSLGLRTPDGKQLTADNYLDFIKCELIASAQAAKDAGAEIPDSIGFKFSEAASFGAPPINGGKVQEALGKKLPQGALPKVPGMAHKQVGEYIIDLDMNTYLNYVASKTALKTAPVFDSKGVAGNAASGENEEFGNEKGTSVNFTDYSAAKNGGKVSDEVEYLSAIEENERRGQAPSATDESDDSDRSGERDCRSALVYSPRLHRSRHCVSHTPQSGNETSERRKRRQLSPGMESSSQRRLCIGRPLLMD